jgi:hypothetical protein
VSSWPLPVPRRDPAQVRAKAHRIVSSFQPRKASGLVGDLEQWLRDVGRWIADAFNWVGRLFVDAGHGDGAATALAVVLLLVALGAAVLLILRSGVRSGRRRRPDAGVSVSTEVLGLSPAGWRAEADRLRAAGQHRDALRCLHRALIAELAARRLLEEVPGRTSGEYARRLSAVLPAARHEMAQATDAFERCWYGRAPVVDDDLDRFEVEARRVIDAAPIGVGPARTPASGGHR